MMSGEGDRSSQSHSNIATEEMGFLITVLNIENIILPKKVIVKIDFNGENVDTSPIIQLDEKYDLNWKVFFEVTNLGEIAIDSLVAHPFLFSVLYEEVQMSLPADKLKKRGKGQKKGTQKKLSTPKSSLKGELSRDDSVTSIGKQSNKSERTKSKNTSKKNFAAVADKSDESFATLGIANLDLIPLLQGEAEIEELLLIHPPMEGKGSQAVAWANLPKMRVSVVGQGGITDVLRESMANILFITLESLQNITPEFTEHVEVATIVPQSEDFEVVKFTNGRLVVDNRTLLPRRKKWFGLSALDGQGSLSMYNNENSVTDIQNAMDYQVSQETLESIPRIQWNHLLRSFVSKETQQILKNKLIKYRCWPVGIKISNSPVTDTSQSKSKSGTKASSRKGGDGSDMGNNCFIAFPDLSRLLYPGMTSTKVVSQLYTYVEGVMERQFGSEHTMFQVSRAPSVKVDKSAKSSTPKKDQSRATTPKSAKRAKVPDLPEIIEEKPPPPPEPEAVFNANGEPVFIVVQIELLKPLIEKRSFAETLARVEEIIPKRREPSDSEKLRVDAIQIFETSIQSLVNAIHEEYQLFYNKSESFLAEGACRNFLMHLHMTGAYSRMKECVMEGVEGYIHKGLGFPHKLHTLKTEHQEKLTEIYSALVSKMCCLVNAKSCSDVDEYDPMVPSDNLLYFAIEATEEGHYNKAQEYLLQRIEKSNKADPQCWLAYAKFWVKRREFEKAGDCAREAISLDPTYIPALSFLGLLSWLTEDFSTAETFLVAAVTFDPYAMDGWLVLYMFHKQMNQLDEANTELLNGKRCARDSGRTTSPRLIWCPLMEEKNRIFLATAVNLICMSFPELAELALSYDLMQHGRTVGYLYYLAVCHYEQGRYGDSLDHIEEALKMVWEEDRLWSLKGHNLYKQKLFMEAKLAFQFALNFSEVKEDRDDHMIKLRLGSIFLSEGDHHKAYSYYLTICSKSPTPLSWLGLGITAFLDDEMDDAELALSEANLLDCRQPQVWGYLALVNLLKSRREIYHRCLSQALRYGLDDPVLLERLNVLGTLVESS